MAQSPFRNRVRTVGTDITDRTDTEVSYIANPVPLGLTAYAVTTAILGCVYAGFILPHIGTGISLLVAVAFIWGGIIQVLAGMWEFRRDNTLAATLFTTYGGFLATFGIVFFPRFGLLAALSLAGALHAALGLFFLVWTITAGVLFIGSLRTHAAMFIMLVLLFVAFLLFTIAELAGFTGGALYIAGGWCAIVSALFAWYIALVALLIGPNSPAVLPLNFIQRRRTTMATSTAPATTMEAPRDQVNS
jgi:succinate-acetate transporter protein